MKTQNRHVLTLLAFAAVVAVGALAAAAAQAAGGPSLNARAASGIVWTHGQSGSHGQRPQAPNLAYHGGPVQTGTTRVYPIFWGSSWSSYTGDEISGISGFYSTVGGSSYAGTNTEYTDSSKQHVSSSVTLAAGALTDTSAAPTNAPSTGSILAEVAKEYPNPVAGAYYPVYIDQPRGHAGYCAWHSSGTINGVEVQFGFFFKLDGDAGCDPGSPNTSQSEGLAALGNVSGHELSEMLTDPQLNAWYDSKGAENADKCAWTFGSKLVKLGGTSWKIQGNWSNSAYNANKGYTDASAGFVRGCVDGTNA